MTDASGNETVFVPDFRSEITPEVRLKMYAAMTRARVFEKRAYDLFMSGLVKGTTHLGTGQEAVAAGFSTAMRHDDMVFCTYRGHNHTLLRGAPMDSLMGELLGRESGCCGGKGGSMHLTDVEQHAMGSYAIVGAHLPVAAGTAWASQERGTGQVTVCFFGDGTTNIGAFHESLNMAAVWGLPVVFVCENNLYMEYTPISSVTAVPNPAADQGRCLRARPDHRGRERRRRRVPDCTHGPGTRPFGRRPLPHRGSDLPALRPFTGRSGQVSPQRGGRRPG